MKSDLTFFTNEPNSTLLDRFKKTLQNVKYFDILVGFFRTSGFHYLYESFESIEKIRILVGLNVDIKTYEIIDFSRKQSEFDFDSHKKVKQTFSNNLTHEMDNSQDIYETEIGIKKFIDFIISGKIDIKAYPSKNIHAKVYISRFNDNDRDYGRVITGSSNFSESGLIANREFNVELKNRADVEFALDKFEELWNDSVDLSEVFIETIYKNTWLNDQITPYEIYIKFLYEYLKEDINIDEDFKAYLPEGFMELDYQKQAVLSAKKILDAYNGVFISDVVGLGKTFICALLAQQFVGKILVICPPVLKEYWEETFFEFGLRGFKIESAGKLDNIMKKGYEKYDYVIIDEAHRFRNELTQGYEQLHEIAYGKKVILVSATPLNNTLDDIYSQLKLFQTPKKSTIPGVANLTDFFDYLKKKLNKINKTDPEYINCVKAISKEIRDKVLKHVMIRRTRKEIQKYFNDDIKTQGLSFPELDDPQKIIYAFNSHTEYVFAQTIQLLIKFSYSRYTPLLFLKHEISAFEQQSQHNVGGFMKGILVKRLESSFYAFKKTLRRFIESYEKFIDMFNTGNVYISKKINVYDFLDSDNEDELLKFVDQEKVKMYESIEFTDEFPKKLKSDLDILKKMNELWQSVNDDPKLNKFIFEINNNNKLINKKMIVFTESRETGEYLYKNLNKILPDKIFFYSSTGGMYEGKEKSHQLSRDLIKENYDPKNKQIKNDIQILISTDVLAEGINLHKSNIVLNYDLPWNPTRIMQRVGRINRVGTEHNLIHIFNFFPTAQADTQLGLEANIKAKIQAFHDTLGDDAKYLTDEEIVTNHELFGESLYKRWTDKNTYQGNEDDQEQSELEYLKILRDIRDKQPDFFEKIKKLPKKARSCRKLNLPNDNLITFFRKGKLKKFFITDGINTKELTFFDAVTHFKCKPDTIKFNNPQQYYSFLKKNKDEFEFITSDEFYEQDSKLSGGRSNESYVIKRLKAKDIKHFKGFTEENEEYIKKIISALEDGILPKKTSKNLKNQMQTEINPLKILAILQQNIPENLIVQSPQKTEAINAQREVILSEFLLKDDL